ncbi:MAG: hypothetical protein M3342_10495 [Bacteroidota bacterium]|nr:hypothetical protein [Flavisolibacter sp.]MDQ3844427.1 hypothetical protein [Bacteroidota bacterium]MBD0286196.1 hypothetical protein [Flavisolibacter sp.]MBD0295264.1 hypothetical protein [Flavisolibacter sp.]MBD0350157.1 hypothetical protein [Flavisolibacter sp.]
MLFENWKVTDDGIEWKGEGLHRFSIPKDDLNRTRPGNNEKQKYYDWILLATDEDWLTQNDLYDLNFAFVYAIAKFGLEFNYEVFDATLAEQYNQFEEEDNEDYLL